MIPHFNPRAPCGARPMALAIPGAPSNFNPRAPCGARLAGKVLCCCWIYFNPRAPCGARRFGGNCYRQSQRFQSTRPLRGATDTSRSGSYHNRFQSTRPLRGATGMPLGVEPSQQISIHAPLAGRDRSRWDRLCNLGDFNPRAPCGARRRIFPRSRRVKWISIHAPLAGRDCIDFAKNADHRISIHAPLAGRDGSICHDGCTSLLFQSTRPLRGATAKVYKLLCTFLR